MGAVAWASWQRSVSHPRSSNRSADLRHPALRLVSPMIQTAAKIDAITNGRNAEWSLAFPIRLRNHHPLHRIGPIRLRDQFLAQACKPLLQTRCFDRREGYSVHSRRSRIGAGQRIGMAQDVFPVNLVVEQVEAERRLGLRLTIQLSLKGLDRYRCCQAHRQSPSPHHLRKHTRSHLCSTGIAQLQRSYDPVRLPPGPPPVATLRLLPSPMTGLPRLPEPPFPRAVPTTPADRAGACVDLLPRSRGLPQMAGGSASALSLSRPAQASLALRPAGSLSHLKRPSSRGSSPASYPAKLLVSFRINRQLSGWNLPPLMIRAFEAHCQQATYAVQQNCPIR